MSEVLLLKLAHVLGLAYWLGADLGVFYSSYFVANDKLSPEVRVAAAKILFALDQAPRICMTLMLPLGVHLAWRLGVFGFGAGTMVAIWIACLGWLAMVVVLHAAAASPAKALLTRFDFGFRLSLSIALIAVAAASLAADAIAMPYWVAWKLGIFGGLVGCGLMVRVALKEFGPAFANLARGEPGNTDNAAIRHSLTRTRPFVVTIWIGLIASAALGIHLI